MSVNQKCILFGEKKRGADTVSSAAGGSGEHGRAAGGLKFLTNLVSGVLAEQERGIKAYVDIFCLFCTDKATFNIRRPASRSGLAGINFHSGQS